jgi:predicted pyridoxine 5'-phosphate oxidase superfamily flavin-nucleotide-binding protein
MKKNDVAARALFDGAFGKGEREAQRRWSRRRSRDPARLERLLLDHIPAEYHARIEAVPFFFLATSNRRGQCDCSFKGGGPGLVRVLDTRTLAFPDFRGNQLFMSLGNVLENPHVGLLFIDFEDGSRLRVNGLASIHDAGPPLELFPEAPRVVIVDIEEVTPNCAAYVPRLRPIHYADEGHQK